MNKKKPNNVTEFYKNNKYIILYLTLVILVQIVYRLNATANVPIMDYWRYINQIGEQIFNGGISASSIIDIQGSQIGGLNNFLLLINIIFFDWNTRIEIILGIFVTATSSITLYIYFLKTLKTENSIKKNKFYNYFIFFFITMFLFNFNQWEIFLLEFSFAFAVRIFMYICIFINIDKLLIENSDINFGLGLIIIFTITFCSGAYFVAFVISIIGSLVLNNIVKFRNPFKFEKNKLVILICTLIGTIIYMSMIKKAPSGELASLNLLEILFNVNFLKGCLYLFGGALMHGEITIYNNQLYYIIGFYIIILALICMIIYFKTKMYKITYIPFMLMIYGTFNICMITIGRSSFRIEYLKSSRYSCETTLILISIFWIILYYFKDKEFGAKQSFLILFCTISLGFLCISFIHEINIAEYRRQYQLNLITIMKDIENYEDDSLKSFQATSPQQVRDGVNIMKKYKLGVFKYY